MLNIAKTLYDYRELKAILAWENAVLRRDCKIPTTVANNRHDWQPQMAIIKAYPQYACWPEQWPGRRRTYEKP